MPKIPASERDAFYASRRGELAEVALKLWAERGFAATSVETVAREAGISKGTFYLYFESKQALLEEVTRRNSLVPLAVQLLRDLQDAPLEQAVPAFVKASWEHLSSRRELILLALHELPANLEQAQQTVEHVMAPVNQAMASYLESRLPEARARELSLVIAARSLLGMVVFTFVSQEILGMGKVLPVSREQITDTLASMFLHGVSGAPEGVS